MTSTRAPTVVASRPGKAPYKLIIILAFLLLVSCKTPFPQEPQKGDVRVIDGVEYIYGKNPKYMVTPQEPLYVWLRRDQFAPDTLDDFAFRAPVPTERQNQLQARLEKLEAEVQKGQPKQQSAPAPAPRPAPIPSSGTPGPQASLSSRAPDFPAPQKIKQRVLLLPINDSADSKYEKDAEQITARLMANLENTGMIRCVSPRAVGFRGPLAQPGAMKALDENHGIQAVVQGTLFDTPASSNTELSLTIYNAETGMILRQLSTRLPLLDRRQGVASEAERTRLIDNGIARIAEDVVKTIVALDWHARIVSIEQNKISINAGRSSGLEKGDRLAVYAPGAQITDTATKIPLGNLKGTYKGDVEIVELVGEDSSLARAPQGEKLSPADLVYLKK
jgi:hypothetical protein